MKEKDSQIQISRDSLYNDIWEISVSGVAKKYEVPYSLIMKKCQEANIPTPPSGYWTKVEFGKSVEKISLPDSDIKEIELFNSTKSLSIKKNTIKKKNTNTEVADISPSLDKAVNIENKNEQKVLNKKEKEAEGETEYIFKPINCWHQDRHIIYDRTTLYNEVWNDPVTKVAIKYGVSGTTIKKVCQELNIPVPQRGYWAKLEAGQPVTKTSLLPTDGSTKKIGTRSFIAIPIDQSIKKIVNENKNARKNKIDNLLCGIHLAEDFGSMHKKVLKLNEQIKDYYKDNERDSIRKRPSSYESSGPFCAQTISEQQLPRALRIIDVLVRFVEAYGGIVRDDFLFEIDGEIVRFDITESQDEINHLLSREEAREKLEYEDRKKHGRWATEPNIRKYDYAWNGNLHLSFPNKRRFWDTNNKKIEEQFPEIISALFEEVDITKTNRLFEEKEKRIIREKKRLEELKERLKREQKERKKKRIENERQILDELISKSMSLSLANQIRDYCNEYEIKFGDTISLKQEKYLKWARDKADNIDPLIDKDDEILGKIVFCEKSDKNVSSEGNEKIVYVDKTVPYWYFTKR